MSVCLLSVIFTESQLAVFPLSPHQTATAQVPFIGVWETLDMHQCPVANHMVLQCLTFSKCKEKICCPGYSFNVMMQHAPDN